jgi:predicted DNA repair protein MutK
MTGRPLKISFQAKQNMASGFFAILDDIAFLMDDVALATKVATRKTAGILGDDLAVNAEKATGFLSEREIPVLWSITKGSLINKLIIVPAALLLNVFLPVAITIILLLGGVYLAYEGVEKIVEYFFHPAKKEHSVIQGSSTGSETINYDNEKEKVKTAVTTDFILSIEIVIIALGSVVEQTLTVQIVTVSAVALLATVGVYGVVALIVRMDDLGYKIIKRSNDKGLFSKLGHLLVRALPFIIRFLGTVGTFALILVSGGIFVHNIEYLHHLFPGIPSTVKEFAVGLVVGIAAVAVFTGVKKVLSLAKR